MACTTARRALLVVLIAMSAFSCKSDYSPDPTQLAEKATSCFGDNNIYSGCNKEYRLGQTGYINVPSAATDQFCYGPCLAETHRVLDCVERILPNFAFYNKATIKDVRDTLQSGCSRDGQRGNFNVARYLSDEMGAWSIANGLTKPNMWFTSTLVCLLMLLGFTQGGNVLFV